MTEIQLPLSIRYQTTGVSSIEDVIASLQAIEAISKDAVSLLPSLIDGLQIDECSLNVREISQGSLKEAVFLALLVTYQSDLEKEVPPLIEDLFKVSISDKYDTIATVAFMIVLFYGAGIAIDLVKRAVSDSLSRDKLDELIDVLALETGKSASDIRHIVESRFQKASSVKRVVREAKRFFQPSQKDKNAPVEFDRDLIPTEVVREVPYPGQYDDEPDFDKYVPYAGVDLELHAQDRDKSTVGWAAVASKVSEERLKVKVMEPVKPSDLWQREAVNADIVAVLKLTSDGYVPHEIQVTKIND